MPRRSTSLNLEEKLNKELEKEKERLKELGKDVSKSDVANNWLQRGRK